jgi:hypothetical protein
MIHTVPLNNEFDVLTKETSRGETNKNCSDKIAGSERYMSSEEFRKRVIEKVNKFCDIHGVL